MFGFRYIKAITDVKVTENEFYLQLLFIQICHRQENLNVDTGNQSAVSNAVWSMKGNFLEIPTDCPTRERTGFTGDAQVFVNTGMYLMECIRYIGNF